MKCQVDAIQWGGIVAEFFRGLREPTRRDSVGGGSARNFPLMGPFYIFSLSQRGGAGPLGPPESATACQRNHSFNNHVNAPAGLYTSHDMHDRYSVNIKILTRSSARLK